MKSVHYLLFVLLPVILNAASDDTRMGLVKRRGENKEFRRTEDFLKVPAQDSQMPATTVPSGMNRASNQPNLSQMQSSELWKLRSKQFKRYNELLKDHECCIYSSYCCPSIILAALGTYLTYNLFQVLDEPIDDRDLMMKSVAFGAGEGILSGAYLGDKIVEAYLPELPEIAARIKQINQELESRKNK